MPLRTPERKSTRGYWAANQALQLLNIRRAILNLPDDFHANVIIDDETGEALEFRDLIKNPKFRDTWMHSYANEIGRLTQGIRDIPGTETMKFIYKHEIPKDRLRDVTYGRIVCTYRPQKSEPNRSRLTAGGNLVNYPWEVATPTGDLITAKLLFNSVISTPGVRFLSMDLKNFYLCTPMLRPEFM